MSVVSCQLADNRQRTTDNYLPPFSALRNCSSAWRICCELGSSSVCAALDAHRLGQISFGGVAVGQRIGQLGDLPIVEFLHVEGRHAAHLADVRAPRFDQLHRLRRIVQCPILVSLGVAHQPGILVQQAGLLGRVVQLVLRLLERVVDQIDDLLAALGRLTGQVIGGDQGVGIGRVAIQSRVEFFELMRSVVPGLSNTRQEEVHPGPQRAGRMTQIDDPLAKLTIAFKLINDFAQRLGGLGIARLVVQHFGQRERGLQRFDAARLIAIVGRIEDELVFPFAPREHAAVAQAAGHFQAGIQFVGSRSNLEGSLGGLFRRHVVAVDLLRLRQRVQQGPIARNASWNRSAALSTISHASLPTSQSMKSISESTSLVSRSSSVCMTARACGRCWCLSSISA